MLRYTLHYACYCLTILVSIGFRVAGNQDSGQACLPEGRAHRPKRVPGTMAYSFLVLSVCLPV